jgi:putative ABC transport system permease protein
MIRNYFKSAFRNLWKYKAFSFINIAGLSIGLASSFIIMLYALNELSYDRYNERLDRIYLATMGNAELGWNDPVVPFLMGPALKEEVPGIEQVARFFRSNCPITYRDKSFDRAYCLTADPSIFQILTLPLESGSLEGLSSARDYAVINHSTARKIFGNANPIGEVLTINFGGDVYNLRVVGVMKDMPPNTTMKAEIVVPLAVAEKWGTAFFGRFTKNPLESWSMPTILAYVLVSPSVSQDQIENEMASFSARHPNPNQNIQYGLFPLKDIYYHSSGLTMNLFPSGDMTNVYVYSTIGVLILLIACINFVILSTGRASIRTKEIAMRKIVGATRLDLMKQVMTESITVSLFSLPIAILLVDLFFPAMSQLLGKRMVGTYYHDLNHLLLFLGITILAGILSGSYVSFYLSGFRPLDILRSKPITGTSRATLRKIMIAVQMVIFIGLIIASITIYRQLRYFHSRSMGYDKSDLVVLSSGLNKIGTKIEALKTELKSNPAIVNVSGADFLPGTESGSSHTVPSKSDPSLKIKYDEVQVDRDFIETMKMRMVSGKSFAEATPEEREHAVILNESAVKAFGISDPSQETILDQRILGVVRDFNVRSLRERIPPLVLACELKDVREVAVRLRHDADLPRTISFIQTTSARFNNGRQMSLQFFDERLDDMYGNDYRFGGMIGYFTGLAILIACLGLFGVSLFVIQTRVKEIGIRKVMGASTGTLFYLLTREFILLIAASTVIAVPITIYYVNAWLHNYAYRVGVNVFVVLIALLAAMVIVLLTIGYQVIKAAAANPVEALRYE